MTTTAAERQRKRRRKLRDQGIIDMTVKVPLVTKPAMRELARALRENPNYPIAANRLAPTARALKNIQQNLITIKTCHVGVDSIIVMTLCKPAEDEVAAEDGGAASEESSNEVAESRTYGHTAAMYPLFSWN